MKADKDVIYAVMGQIENMASTSEYNAGMSGSWGDGGASIERLKTRFYRDGMNGVVPTEWESLYHTTKERLDKQKAMREDPEYAEFMRLKKKFG